jgi:hypothetical protein
MQLLPDPGIPCSRALHSFLGELIIVGHLKSVGQSFTTPTIAKIADGLRAVTAMGL